LRTIKPFRVTKSAITDILQAIVPRNII
jgi:hypothetical protein